MGAACATPLNADEFYALPERDFGCELVRGQVIAEPPPRAWHGRVAAQIAYALQRYIRGGGRPGVVLVCDTWFELSHSPATVRGPDVAFMSRQRYASLDENRPAVDGAPDLAIEVRSPSQSVRVMRDKAGDYLAAGAAEVWIVDVDAVCLAVCRAPSSTRLLRGDDVLTSPDVLPGFAVGVRDLIALDV